ncbi:MAG: hypothetical protein J6S60_06340 [Oscillospiraceae bacterium]|nr:hypothetical protein [Oscillospiraceae bacterium]
MKRALTLILAVCLCLCLIAPASAAYDSSPFVGNWKIYSQEGSTPMTHEELLAMAEMGMDMANSMIVTFRDDGTMKINVFGETIEGTWTDNGDGTGTFGMEGEFLPMAVVNGFLMVDMGTDKTVFEPADVSADDASIGLPPLLEEYVNQIEQQVEMVMPKEETIVSPLIGEWRFYSMESGDPDQNIPHSALPGLRDEGRDYAGKYTLTFMDDGWFKFCNFYGFEQNNWTDSKDSPVTVYADGKSWDCTIEDGLLVLRSGDNVMRYERTVPIGSTGYYVAVPADYVPGEVTEEDRRDDMVAYYRSDKHLMDFDIYQFAKDGRILEEYAEKEAKEFGADWIDTVVFNGVPLVFYISQEQYDGAEYRVANFLFDAGNDFGEIVFWLDGPNDGEEAAELTEQILSSIFYRKPDPEDVNGMIVMKLEGEYFPDRYQVLGKDGEMYEGEYRFGFEDLEPGTAVILSWRNGKWSIELEDPWATFG